MVVTESEISGYSYLYEKKMVSEDRTKWSCVIVSQKEKKTRKT